MKVFINRKPPPADQPWGGGAKSLRAIIAALEKRGHDVSFRFRGDDDIIFIFDPRSSPPEHAGYQEMLRLQRERLTLTGVYIPIIQRVGDLGTHSKPDLMALVQQTTPFSDVVVFPSEWAKGFAADLLSFTGQKPKGPWHVIPNAPDALFRKHQNRSTVRPGLPVRLITHHWSTNDMKGFDFYKKLDEEQPSQNYQMSYVGRLPSGFQFKNVEHLGVMTDEQLAQELPKHDIYLTASKLEAGANHVLEAIACGLPVLHHIDGGSINEYCTSYGMSFNDNFDSFLSAMYAVLDNFPKLKKNIIRSTSTVQEAAIRYVDVMEAMVRRCNIA